MRLLALALVLLSACRATPAEDKAGPSVDDTAGSVDEPCDPEDVEICDGVDNNCDGVVDEGVTRVHYADADRDGFGDPDAPREGCEAPAGHVENDGDCDDADPAVYPSATEVCNDADDDCDGTIDEGVTITVYADADGDGFGDVASSACAVEPGWSEAGEDCDDTDPDAFPGNPEVCDEVDNDCDGVVDEGVTTTFYADVDGDSWGDLTLTQEACVAPTGYAPRAEDCDDADASIHPDAAEVCDTRDQNCDGLADEGLDADEDGLADCYDVEQCDGVDNDGDGVVDEPDAVDASTWHLDYDGDGFGGTRFAEVACSPPDDYVANATDCVDEDDAIHPAADEVCDNVDNNCDGVVDEGLDADEDDLADCYDTEECDGVDNDGDRLVDEGYDSDGDALADCFDIELCDGLDNDGDGLVDDEDGTLADPATWYADTDGDGYGDPALMAFACDAPDGYVAVADDCDDTRGAVFPGAAELCNRRDDDCDGAIDEGTSDSDGDGTCDALDSEACDGLDNDGDGSADEGLRCSYRLVRSDLSSGLCVDDDMYVNLNGTRIYTDTSWGAQCGHTVSFTATPGDSLTIWAVDSVGSCRSMDDVYIVNVAAGVGQRLATGYSNTCGHSASTSAFWSATVAVPGAF